MFKCILVLYLLACDRITVRFHVKSLRRERSESGYVEVIGEKCRIVGKKKNISQIRRTSIVQIINSRATFYIVLCSKNISFA